MSSRRAQDIYVGLHQRSYRSARYANRPVAVGIRLAENAAELSHTSRGSRLAFANVKLVPRIGNTLPNFSERGAPRARRDDREYSTYSRKEQRRHRGCPARKMATYFRFGTLGRLHHAHDRAEHLGESRFLDAELLLPGSRERVEARSPHSRVIARTAQDYATGRATSAR